MTQKEWDDLCAQVVNEMLEYTKPFSTPISKVLESDYGEHLGSGSFLSDGESIYLVTNEHVAKELNTISLAHQFFGSDEVVRIMNPFCAKEYPVDVALTKIKDEAWNVCQHRTRPIPVNRFSEKHEPTDGELMFMIGYSGERSDFHFGTLFSPGTPYLTQAVDFPEELGDIRFHFSIHYKPDLAVRVNGSTRGLPLPPGMSGSFVWNTRFVETIQKNETWSPENSCVTGIVWGWPSSDAILLATRVEHMMLSDLLVAAKSVA